MDTIVKTFLKVIGYIYGIAFLMGISIFLLVGCSTTKNSVSKEYMDVQIEHSIDSMKTIISDLKLAHDIAITKMKYDCGKDVRDFTIRLNQKDSVINVQSKKIDNLQNTVKHQNNMIEKLVLK